MREPKQDSDPKKIIPDPQHWHCTAAGQVGYWRYFKYLKDKQWLSHICLKKMVTKPRPLDHRSKTQAFGKMTRLQKGT
jgi:hypothetical protein